MELLVMASIAFGATLIVRRKESLILRWQPVLHTWAAVGTGLLAFLLSASLLQIQGNSLERYIILYGSIYLLCGFALPWGYTLLVERSPLALMGVKREGWRCSLILNLALGGLLSLFFVTEADLGVIEWKQFARASLVLAGAGGLFELFLYYGFIHLRLEKAFGVIPAILGSAALYVLWHAGTQLPMEPDLLAGVIKLFLVGVLYQSIFALTRNLLVIWPFFHWAGVMLDFTLNLDEIKNVSQEFNWAIGSLLGMLILGLILNRLRRRQAFGMPVSSTA
jgi:membrane protease YdiL (CAAX protease family)